MAFMLDLLAVCVAFLGPPANPLDIRGAPAERIVISSVAQEPLPGTELDSPMLAKLSGVMAVLKGPDAKALRSAGPGTPPIDPVTDAERIAFIHLQSKGGSKTIELAQTQAGLFVLFELTPQQTRGDAFVPKQDVIGSKMAEWDLFDGVCEARPPDAKPPAGTSVKLEGPYVPGWFVLDQEQMGDRLLSGGKTTVKGAQRVLATQELWVRLPRGYDPTTPAGVMVWIDPTEAGLIPGEYHAVLDERNIIAVGASAMGNSHEMSDRLQLAFDGLANVCRKFHVDPKRMYVTGVSGGGRLSSILIACFPDVFAGGVPIVGVACYENLPTGVGGFWAGLYRKPPGKLFGQFKRRPMAVVTGGQDFNQAEIHRAMEVFHRDGCNARLFEWDDLGHAVPSAPRLTEIVHWIDQPAHDAAESSARNAAVELKKLQGKLGSGTMSPQDLARDIRKITQMAPWSAPAWEAARLRPEPSPAPDEGKSR